MSKGMTAQISTDLVAGKDDFAKTTPFHTYRGNVLNGQVVAYEGERRLSLTAPMVMFLRIFRRFITG
jgi:hypothetical protein